MAFLAYGRSCMICCDATRPGAPCSVAAFFMNTGVRRIVTLVGCVLRTMVASPTVSGCVTSSVALNPSFWCGCRTLRRRACLVHIRRMAKGGWRRGNESLREWSIKSLSNQRPRFNSYIQGSSRCHSGAWNAPYGGAAIPTVLGVLSMSEQSDSSNEELRTKHEERFLFFPYPP